MLISSNFYLPKEGFSTITTVGLRKIIQKGQQNSFRVRPKNLGEHAESSREAQYTLGAGTPICGQIFKHKPTNINGIMLNVQSAESVNIDDFEGYANDAALQVVWAETDVADKATISTVVKKTGTQSMQLPMSATTNDEWIKTVSSTDYTGYIFDLDLYQTKSFAQAGLSLILGDGSNTKSFQLAVPSETTWYHFDVNEADFTEDGGTVNMGAITKVGFRLHNRSNNTIGYIDDLGGHPPPGTMGLKLWDFGDTLPVTGTSSLADATQYTELGDRGVSGVVVSEVELQLVGGKRAYQIDDFVAGAAPEIPDNTLLTSDNYYAVTLHYVNTDITVYGPSSVYAAHWGQPYYTNGFAFSTPDEVSVITEIGEYHDLAFSIFHSCDAYVAGYNIRLLTSTGDLATPGGDSTFYVHTETGGPSDAYKSMEITNPISTMLPTFAQLSGSFEKVAYFAPNGSKTELYLADDASDDTYELLAMVSFRVEPALTNG